MRRSNFSSQMKEAINGGLSDLLRSRKRPARFEDGGETNAVKFVEQNREIGLSPDFTMNLLNRYGTYGANTGIGALGGDRLVDALNENYRDKIDAKLPQNTGSREMHLGGMPIEVPEIPIDLDNLLSSIPQAAKDALAAINTPHLVEDFMETMNLPSNIDLSGVIEEFPEASQTLIDKIKTFLEDEKNQKKLGLGVDVIKRIIDAKSIDDAEPAPVRAAPYRGPRPSQVNIPRIGYAAEGGNSSILGRKLFIGGGEVDGPGGPKEDMVPIWASDQEYVVSADAVKKLGGGSHSQGIAALDKLNFGK